jgi:hypothetical protein
MKQVLAIAVAALLVAVAIVVRDAIDSDDADNGDGGEPDADGEIVVACVTELADACEALEGVVLRVQDPSETLADGADVDAWVTLDPWPGIAELQDTALDLDHAAAVARTDLVLLARPASLPDGCADWACVTVATGSNRAALPRAGTALGALLLGHAALGWSEATRPGAPFAANELDLPEFEAWLGALTFVRDPVADMLQLGRAGPAAAGTTAADVELRVAPSAQADALDTSPTPVPAAVAVVVVGQASARVADDDGFRDALAALGWDLDPEAATTGLPGPGVLLALTQEIA